MTDRAMVGRAAMNEATLAPGCAGLRGVRAVLVACRCGRHAWDARRSLAASAETVDGG
ncbi:hypothetical protein DO70_4858 [Burkholderia pseudomallei]|nr:hypothetical protein DO70_4858 [Burkholderia pseudomallei]